MLWGGVALLVLVACADFFAPPLRMAWLSIVPVFTGSEALAPGEADQLRILIERDSSGTFTVVVDTTVGIDAETGTASANVSVLLLQSPQTFIVRLEAFRSSDGTILYSGVDTVEVRESSGEEEPEGVEIPLVVQPLGAASVVIAPSDTAVVAGEGFTFRAAVFDRAGAPIDVPVRYRSSDTVSLQINRLSGAVTTSSSADAVVEVIVHTVDSAAFDTARVAIGRVPAVVVLTPGFLNLASGASAAVEDSVFDAQGNFLGLDVDWASRSTDVATVSSTGTVTAVAAGTAVIVGTTVGAGIVGDSLIVTVPPDSNVVVRTLPSNRTYEQVTIGDTVVVDVMVDMQFADPELLGSYNATLTWDASVLTYVDVQNGNFASPTINESNVSAGELKFGSADANGVGGQVVVAKVRFVAATAGTTSAVLDISEMSAARTFTNLISRVTVTNGFVTVR
jgi:uncharacterized protein YjdB